MIFQWDPSVPLVVDDNIELPQLALVKNHTADCKLFMERNCLLTFNGIFNYAGTQVYSTGNFTCLEVVFVLKRRLGYYLFHTYIPTCLIVIMSWVSFWIKPEAAPARVTLGVTSLLTLSTQHAKSQASLPPVSYLKAVDAFMSVCTIFVFMALMEYCLVNIVLGDTTIPKINKHKQPQAAPAGSSAKEYTYAPTKVNGTLNCFLLISLPEIQLIRSNFVMKSFHRDRTESVDSNNPWIHRQSIRAAGSLSLATPRGSSIPNMTEDIPMLTPQQIRLRRAMYIDKFSRGFFPFLFTLLNVIYWILFYEYL